MTDPRAGQPAAAEDLVDVAKLVTAYFTERPDPSVASQRVAFGTSGHRGSSFDVSFNETLTRLGIPHRFRAVAGGHDAAVWRAQMATELIWIGRQFQRAKA